MYSSRGILWFCMLAIAIGSLASGCGGDKSSEPDATAPAAIDDLGIQSTGCDSVSLAWTAPGDDGTEGRASSYDLRYSSAAINETNWDSATECEGEPVPKPSGQPETMTIDNLVFGVTYYFALKACDDEANESEVSNNPSTTVGSSAIAWVNDGVGEDEDWAASVSTLSANWAGACATDYEYALGRQPGQTDVLGWTSGGTQTQITRSDLVLTDGLTYYWSVRGVFGAVPGTPTFSDGITVDINLPRSQVSPLAETSSSLAFTVTWSGDDPSSDIKQYDIQVKEDAGSWTDWLTGTTLTSSDYTGTVDRTYYFRSRACDLAGNVEAYPTDADTWTVVTCSYAYSTKWGSEGSADGEFDGPFEVALDAVGGGRSSRNCAEHTPHRPVVSQSISKHQVAACDLSLSAA